MKAKKLLIIASLLLFPCWNTSLAEEEILEEKESNTLLLSKNIAISLGGFFLINLAQFQREFSAGKISLASLFAISTIEVSKNLVNYVLIENSAKHCIPAFSLIALNTYRMSLQPEIQEAPSWRLICEASLAEVFKNKLNFEVTENWFPWEWSHPPSYPH